MSESNRELISRLVEALREFRTIEWAESAQERVLFEASPADRRVRVVVTGIAGGAAGSPSKTEIRPTVGIHGTPILIPNDILPGLIADLQAAHDFINKES